MKAKKLVLLTVLLAFALALAIDTGALAKSTPVLTTTAQAATTNAQAATTTVQASLFVAGLVVGLFFFGLVRTVDASRISRHRLAVGTSRHVAEHSQRKRHKHVIHI